jgi:hypothetical protein
MRLSFPEEIRGRSNPAARAAIAPVRTDVQAITTAASSAVTVCRYVLQASKCGALLL